MLRQQVNVARIGGRLKAPRTGKNVVPILPLQLPCPIRSSRLLVRILHERSVQEFHQLRFRRFSGDIRTTSERADIADSSAKLAAVRRDPHCLRPAMHRASTRADYCGRFPIDTLKIDRAFIRDVTLNADDGAITLAIIATVHNLKLKSSPRASRPPSNYNSCLTIIAMKPNIVIFPCRYGNADIQAAAPGGHLAGGVATPVIRRQPLEHRFQSCTASRRRDSAD